MRYSIQAKAKRAGTMACPDFKPQYCPKEKKNKKDRKRLTKRRMILSCLFYFLFLKEGHPNKAVQENKSLTTQKEL
jgi:hypothetical protein